MRSRGRGAWERRQRADLVEETCRRDLAVDDVLHEEAHVVLELACERCVDPELRGAGEVALQQVTQRLQGTHRESKLATQLRRARRADRAARGRAPGVLALLQDLAARDALIH